MIDENCLKLEVNNKCDLVLEALHPNDRKVLKRIAGLIFPSIYRLALISMCSTDGNAFDNTLLLLSSSMRNSVEIIYFHGGYWMNINLAIKALVVTLVNVVVQVELSHFVIDSHCLPILFRSCWKVKKLLLNFWIIKVSNYFELLPETDYQIQYLDIRGSLKDRENLKDGDKLWYR